MFHFNATYNSLSICWSTQFPSDSIWSLDISANSLNQQNMSDLLDCCTDFLNNVTSMTTVDMFVCRYTIILSRDILSSPRDTTKYKAHLPLSRPLCWRRPHIWRSGEDRCSAPGRPRPPATGSTSTPRGSRTGRSTWKPRPVYSPTRPALTPQ